MTRSTSTPIALALALGVLALPGCTWRDAQGEHTLVLGVGMVTTRHEGPSAARATRSAAAGVLLAGDGLLVGWRSSQTIELEPGADARLEAGSTEGGFTVDYRPSRRACAAPDRAHKGVHRCDREPFCR